MCHSAVAINDIHFNFYIVGINNSVIMHGTSSGVYGIIYAGTTGTIKE